MSNRWKRQVMTDIKLWLKGMQSNETWFQYMYWQLVEKQCFIQQLIWSYPNRRKLQTLEICHHRQAEICRRNPRKPKSRRLLDITVLENTKFEENHELNFIIVFNHKWNDSLSYLILGMFVCLGNSQFCFRFHELTWWSVVIRLVSHRQLTFRGSLHLEDSACSSNMKICSRNHSAVK